MKFDIDTYREILDTITRNKSRSFLTGFGVFWGVFMLVFLLGGDKGLVELMDSNFDGFAKNSLFVYTQETSKPYKGFNKGRHFWMEYKDLDRLREQVPELDVITPMVFSPNGGACTSYYNDKKATSYIRGIAPDYAKVSEPNLRYGRFINEADSKERRKVCVIGKRVYKELFGTGDPCGQRIRIDSTFYEVVGVDYPKNEISIGGPSDETISIPLTLMQKVYNYGNAVDVMAMTVRKGVSVSSITPRVRAVIAHAHSFDPADEKALAEFNTEVLFSAMQSLYDGLGILVWIVGIGTLLAGAIGVSNIMLVTVRERTTEIGIRRAIGATPRVILSQVISESAVLTLVSGLSGVIFGVAILQMMELANTEDGIVNAHFQVDFWTAILAALIICALGVLAGLPPAMRAMSIKPVDAMRDE